MTLATLGGLPLDTNPNEIRWNFRMKTSDQNSIGGKVIQILGTTLSDIVLRGAFGRGQPEKGDKEGWQQQLRFRNQVNRWASAVEQGHSVPLRFTYAPRNWDFRVFLKTISVVEHTVEEFNPKWEMSLFPVDDGATRIISGVKDLYIARIADGVGWKQTDYNGPTQAEVDEKLSATGGSAVDYIRNKFSSEFVNGPSPSTGVQQ